jgi:hypothetical protein
MKKALLLLFIGGLLNAQISDLLSNNWYISKMVTSTGVTTNTPVMDMSVPASTFTSAGSSYVFTSRYYNQASFAFGIIPGTTNMIKTAQSCTLLFYNGGNATAVRNYDQKNCDFYINGAYASVYSYVLTTTGTLKTLAITDPSGNKIYYNNTANLGTSDLDLNKKSFEIYPNPVNDVLNVNNAEKNVPVKIFDISGKIVLQTASSDKNFKIDVSSLPTGQYILNIENYTATKFSKN